MPQSVPYSLSRVSMHYRNLIICTCNVVGCVLKPSHKVTSDIILVCIQVLSWIMKYGIAFILLCIPTYCLEWWTMVQCAVALFQILATETLVEFVQTKSNIGIVCIHATHCCPCEFMYSSSVAMRVQTNNTQCTLSDSNTCTCTHAARKQQGW